MTSAQLLAAGPVKLRAQSLQAYRHRHVYHVVGCSNQQRNSTLRWGRKPATKVQAVSEEVVDSVAGNGTQNGNGTVSRTVPIKQSTLSVHAGESGGRCKVADSLTTPICCTSTYYFQDTAELIAYQEGRYGSYEYGRYCALSYAPFNACCGPVDSCLQRSIACMMVFAECFAAQGLHWCHCGCILLHTLPLESVVYS